MRWKDFFLKDWFLKLIALSFSILLWSFVVGQEKAEIGISVPLEIVNLPPTLVIANDIPSSVEIRIYGPRSIIKNIASQNLTKVIDLKNAVAGKELIHLAPDDFALPGGIKVMRIKPSLIEIELEPLLRKTIKIKPVLLNSVALDYEIEKVTIEPLETQISGAAREVAKLKYLELTPINLKRARQTFSQIVDPDLQGLHITVEGPSKFKVTIFIKPARGERKINHIPVRIRYGEYKAIIWPSEVSITLCGEKPALKKVKIEDIEVKIDISHLKPGTYLVAPVAKPPEGFNCIEITPEKIKVRVKRGERL